MPSPHNTPAVPFTSPAERLRARLWLFFVDHGLFRELFYANVHRLSSQAWRSAQPAPWQLKRWQRRYGLQSVVNVRGSGWHEPHMRLEAEACAKLGITLHTLHGFGSRELPSRAALNQAKALFEQLHYPTLFHCKSGADRAGLASVLFLHWHEGRPLTQALQQLRLFPFGHIRHANTGILDHFFDSYLIHQQAHPDCDLLTWINQVYDPQTLARSFKPWYSLSWVVDKLLRRE